MYDWIDPFLPVAVGSFPHATPGEALALIFRRLPLIPLWPQLPRRSFHENMYVQYSGGMPSVKIDEARGKLYLDTAAQPERDLALFWEHALSADLDWFAFPEGYAAGFTEFCNILQKNGAGGAVCLKGQVTGPFSFGLTVTDHNDRAIVYNQEYFEAVVAGVSLHARWQAEMLKRFHERVIIFIDEPYLVSYGSAFVSIERREVVSSINATIEAIHEAGALAGIHCCGNTDWSLLLETDLDILNFDAFQFFDNVVLYAGDIKSFLERGGVMAWGIAPSEETILSTSVDSLERKLGQQVVSLADCGIDRKTIRHSSVISPACGMGSQTEQVAEEALAKLQELSARMKDFS